MNLTLNVNVSLSQLAELITLISARGAQLDRIEKGVLHIVSNTDQANTLLAQLNEVTNAQATVIQQIAASEQTTATEAKAILALLQNQPAADIPADVVTKLQAIVDRSNANKTALDAQADFSNSLAKSLENPIPNPVPPAPTPTPSPAPEPPAPIPPSQNPPAE